MRFAVPIAVKHLSARRRLPSVAGPRGLPNGTVLLTRFDDWKNIAAKQKENGPVETKHLEGLDRLGFVKFRMMIALQICCLTKVVLEVHANLNNLVCPVASLGAAKQVDHLESS